MKNPLKTVTGSKFRTGRDLLGHQDQCPATRGKQNLIQDLQQMILLTLAIAIKLNPETNKKINKKPMQKYVYVLVDLKGPAKGGHHFSTTHSKRQIDNIWQPQTNHHEHECSENTMQTSRNFSNPSKSS